MIRTATTLLVEFSEIIKVQRVYHGVNDAHGVVFGDIFVDSLRKQHQLVVYVRAKVELCGLLISFMSLSYKNFLT